MSKLIKNTIIYTIGRILPQAAGFILLPLYSEYLSLEQYGIVESMLVLSAVLSIIFSMATERSLFRLYYDYKNNEEKKRLVGNITLLIITSGIILLLLVFTCQNIVTKIYSEIDFYPYFVYAILMAYFASFSFIPQTLFQVQEKAMSFSIISILAFFTGVGFILYFIIIEKQGAIGLLKGKMMGSIAMLPIYLYIIKKNAIFSFSKKYIKNILTFSLPMLPTLLTAWVVNMSNRIFIEQYFSLEEVGLFSVAFKITSVITIFLGALFTAYNPMFYRLANEKNREKAKDKLSKSHNLLAFIIVSSGFLLAMFSKELVVLFLNERYRQAALYIPILVLSVIFVQLGGLYNLMIYQNKKSNTIMYISIVGALFSIGLNFAIVPRWGAYGAAWVNVLTSAIIMLLTIFYAKRNYYIQLKKGLITIAFATGILLALINDTMPFSYAYLTFKLLVVVVMGGGLYRKVSIQLKRLKNIEK